MGMRDARNSIFWIVGVREAIKDLWQGREGKDKEDKNERLNRNESIRVTVIDDKWQPVMKRRKGHHEELAVHAVHQPTVPFNHN